MRQSLLLQDEERLVVNHVTIFADEAVLPMEGVRIERDVSDHSELGKAALELAHSPGHQALGIESLLGASRLEGRFDNREHGEGGNFVSKRLLRSFQQLVDAPALH